VSPTDRTQDQAPPSDRLAEESSVAYAAYCGYRDLGLARSLEKAWRARVGRAAKPAAKPSTTWELWSSKYQWVQRAAAHDAEIEAIKWAVRKDKIAQLEERRFEYEFRDQDRLESRVMKMDALLDKADAAPVTDVTQELEETMNGKLTRTKTKIKGTNLVGYAAMVKQTNETAQRAITGVREKTQQDASARDVKNLVFRGTSP